MKAWIVTNEYDEYSTVVFAETRNKARLEARATEAWNTRYKETTVYDREDVIEGCTVQILTNTETGETSVGWWRGGIEDMPTWFGTQKSEEDDND